MGKNFSCNNANGNRNKSDFYQTPYSLTKELLKRERFKGTILEPACGEGAIVKVLEEFYNNIFYYDIKQGNDFLFETREFDNIITNPPYSLFLEFILKAKKVAKNKIAMLLPLSYLHGKERLDKVWNDKDFPFKKSLYF